MPQEPSPQQIADQKIYRQMGLIPSEYNRIVELLGRQPNYTETGIFAVMWSEHCSYKNSKTLLKLFPTEGSHILQGPGEGAGVVDIVLTLVMGGQSFSKLRVTIIQQRLSLFRELRLGLVAS